MDLGASLTADWFAEEGKWGQKLHYNAYGSDVFGENCIIMQFLAGICDGRNWGVLGLERLLASHLVVLVMSNSGRGSGQGLVASD